MPSDDQPPGTGMMSDLTGIGAGIKALVGPLERGLGGYLKPWLSRRSNSAALSNAKSTAAALKELGLDISWADLTIGQTTQVRILAENIQKQSRREHIATLSVAQAKLDQHLPTLDLPPADDDWIDRFWRLSETTSNRELQSFWSLVLARRSMSQAVVSARTLEFIATLNGDEAAYIEELSKIAMVCSDKDGHPACGILVQIGDTGGGPAQDGVDKPRLISAHERMRKDLGNLHPEIFIPIGVFVSQAGHSWFQTPIKDGQVEFSISNRSFTAQPRNNSPQFLAVMGGGTRISDVGRELFGVLKSRASPDYVDAVIDAHRANGWEVTEVSSSGN